MSEFITTHAIIVLAIFCATAFPCWGSAKGVGIVGQAGAGLLSEDPDMFGKVLVLQALPMTQGIYGFITAFMVMLNTGIVNGTFMSNEITYVQAGYYFFACMPIALIGFISAIHQAKVSAAGVSMIAKQKKQVSKAMISSALVETYAIFSLLVSLLLILFNGSIA
mgnify:CR=1 FL=1